MLRTQPTGATIGSTPERSSRATRIAATAMVSASRPIAAESRKPGENPTPEFLG
jgi:hypothetical protein